MIDLYEGVRRPVRTFGAVALPHAFEAPSKISTKFVCIGYKKKKQHSVSNSLKYEFRTYLDLGMSKLNLLAAWRSKLSNEEWERRTRKILPRGVNGDVYDLADCLLRQALVGPVPNQLFISYLRHAVEYELVSHSAVLSSIAHQSINIRTSQSATLNRSSSLLCLLEFLRSFRDRLSCHGTEIDCLNLCHSLSQLIQWLLKCVQVSIESLQNVSTNLDNIMGANSFYRNNPGSASANLYGNITTGASPNFGSSNIGGLNSGNGVPHNESILGIIDLCAEAILYFVNKPLTKSLLFISASEFGDEFDDILKTLRNVQTCLASFSNNPLIQEKNHHIRNLQQLNINFKSRDLHPSRVAAQQLRCLQMHRIRSTLVNSSNNFEKSLQQSLTMIDSNTNYALFNSLYSLVAFDVILRPARSHKLLARQIATITNFNSAQISMTYCELIRVCLIGLVDADGTPAKVKWAFFTFLKLPKLLIELSKVSKSPLVISTEDTINPSDNYASNQNTNFISDLKTAIERLCEYSPLLDEAEYKCNCDFFKCLVRELIKNDSGLVALKTMDLKKFPTRRTGIQNSDSGGVGAHIMLKTEPVVSTLLKAFDSESNPVELFTFLSQLVNGKQFEFTLNAAASTGRLEVFVKKLVERNELNTISQSERNPYAQAFLFDITFLILTYIAQQYGSEVIGSDVKKTFEKWFAECYNHDTRVNCPKEMTKNCNESTVNNLIQQILPQTGEGIEMKDVNWRDVCFSIPKVMSDLSNAWTQNCLTDEDMKRVSERAKSKMCFIAVVAANWLQCQIRTLNDADRAKPLMLLQSLTKASQASKQQKSGASGYPGLKSENYAERSSLMCSIIRKIYFEFVPKTSVSTSTSKESAYNHQSSNSSSGLNGSDVSSNGESNNDLVNEIAYQSINDKFMSSLTTREIFMANVKQCLARGWLDHKSLYSLSSLFKLIGGECFTNLIVEHILTSHESPSDLSRAVNITFGLFHLDIEACAFALLEGTVPSWLVGEKKQLLLNQPRAFALAHLTVMTIIEVFNNLRASQLLQNSANSQQQSQPEEARRVIVINGIKEEPGLDNGPRESKRMKAEDSRASQTSQDISRRLTKLNNCVSDLMRLFKEIMSDKIMSQRTLFPVLFLQQTVICAREDSNIITVHLQPEIMLDIINLFSSELTFDLVLAISNLSTTNSRKYAAKATCQLAELKDAKQKTKCMSGRFV